MKKQICLIIDSRDAKKTRISLQKEHDDVASVEVTSATHSQTILPLIEKILKQEGYMLQDISGVTVKVDSGSFTGRRVGMTIGLMLGSLLQIPVNERSVHTQIDIPYEQDKWK